MSWHDAAVCRGTDVDFFAEHTRGQAAAMELCAACPVRDACLQDALQEGRYQFGVRGGYSAAQRLRMPRSRVRVLTAVCGTDGGYARHRRLMEPACDACRHAHAVAARVRKVSAPATRGPHVPPVEVVA